MNSPYRTHPASHPAAPAPGKTMAKTIAFPSGPGRGQATSTMPPQADATARLIRLVTLEGDIRQQPHVAALSYHAVNDARTVLGFRQGWLFRRNRRNHFAAEAVSDVPSIDVNAPLVRAVTRLVNDAGITATPREVSLAGLQDRKFPLPCGLLLPLCDAKGEVFAVLLLARDGAWPEGDRTIAARLAATYAHAFRALTPPGLLRTWSLPRWAMLGIPLVLAALSLVPVPMTALAPFEVVAHQPDLVTAPMDGVVAAIAADPNQPVVAGAILFAFEDTRLKAEAGIAAQKVEVAESRLVTARNGAFSDAELKRSVSTAEQELQLAKAEQAYAASLLQRSVVRAEHDGLLIYSARNDWLGKPVHTGEKVMEIADPSRVAYRIELAVSDAIALEPRTAAITESGYHAKASADGTLAYVITALPSHDDAPTRIGLRGTAQVSGGSAPLGFYLLRRPIAAVRQSLGW
jgi:multidrug efflux pump subunit AcrA (membrane-fusion protein)